MRLAHESHLDESEKVNTKEAHILYVSKSFGFKDTSISEAGIADAPFSPFKEYLVTRDDSLCESVVQRARVVKIVSEKSGVGVPCGVCKNGMDKRAQSCSVIKHCWNGVHPNQITWVENGLPKHPGKKLV
jgi:hypothetical protein